MQNGFVRAIGFLTVLLLAFTVADDHEVFAAEAKIGVVQSDRSLNVRSSASADGLVIGQLAPGERIEYVETAGEWVQITYQGQLGYVSAEFLAEQNVQRNEAAPVVGSTLTGTVTASGGLNVRVSPEANATIAGKLAFGAQVEYTQVSGGWAQVTYNGTLGFIHTDYLSNQQSLSAPTEVVQVDTVPSTSQKVRVVLDAGHGGHDPGAVVNAVQEKDVVYQYKEEMKRVLEADGIEVIETRSGNEFRSLAERTNKANGTQADLFLSIHANSYADAGVNGFETHYYDSSTEAALIDAEIRRSSSGNHRGVYQSNLQVLRNSSVPAVLIEVGYMTNPNDLSLLQSHQHQAEVSEAVRRALRKL